METYKRTPLQLFNLPQHFVIPLFQRPYVWNEADQWEPLWSDIRRVAELRIREPHLNAQHFLGAVVLQAHEAGSNNLTTWNVIDGQQRLTTLQLLMDAASAVFTETGFARAANQLEWLTHNSRDYVGENESRLKLRHLNNDHAAFDEVMTAEPPVDHASLRHHDSRIVQAHRYFVLAVRQWLGDPGAEEYPNRTEQLAHVLREALQLVTIELLATENSQEIFETLNARGTPLTAADLIRNFVFQLIEAEGGDTKRAYREDWPFESRFWSKEVSVGRYIVSRSSLFLNQWLVSRLGEEVSPQSTFARFKSYVEHSTDSSMLKLLPTLRQQADLYEAWTEAAARPGGDLTPTEMAFYRMNASGIELLKPLLIWLHEPGRSTPVSSEVARRTITAVESWVYRRQLLRLTGSDLGRIVADLIRLNLSTPVDEIADRVSSHLSLLNVTSTYWPGDHEIELALATDPVYRRFSRGRMRMFLEAIENAYRAETRQPQVERALYPIEHILPQKWEDNWRVDGREAQEERAAHVHRLGNLTLLTSSLNAKVSNGPWISKRQALLRHNTIKLTGRLVEREETTDWDEAEIDQRTGEMVRVLLAVWPVPAGHVGRVIDIAAKAQDWIEVKHLIEAGLVIPGQELVSTHRDYPDATVTVAPDGHLLVDGRRFGTLSGAAKHVRGSVTNGWYFWALPDGRRLRDVRTQFLTATASNVEAGTSGLTRDGMSAVPHEG